MRSENGDFVPAGLETDCCVDDEAFCSADAEVGVDENDLSFRSRRRVHGGRRWRWLKYRKSARKRVCCFDVVWLFSSTSEVERYGRPFVAETGRGLA